MDNTTTKASSRGIEICHNPDKGYYLVFSCDGVAVEPTSNGPRYYTEMADLRHSLEAWQLYYSQRATQ